MALALAAAAAAVLLQMLTSQRTDDVPIYFERHCAVCTSCAEVCAEAQQQLRAPPCAFYDDEGGRLRRGFQLRLHEAEDEDFCVNRDKHGNLCRSTPVTAVTPGSSVGVRAVCSGGWVFDAAYGATGRLQQPPVTVSGGLISDATAFSGDEIRVFFTILHDGGSESITVQYHTRPD